MEIGRISRLALIADQVGDTATASEIRAYIKQQLVPWLEGSNGIPLLYDQTWGGLVSKNGLADFGADYGNGKYNDHYFHYGYHVYAAATIGKAEPDFLE